MINSYLTTNCDESSGEACYSFSNKGTHWGSGISSTASFSTAPNILFFITDDLSNSPETKAPGNTTSGWSARMGDAQDAIQVIKAQGTRIYAIGTGTSFVRTGYDTNTGTVPAAFAFRGLTNGVLSTKGSDPFSNDFTQASSFAVIKKLLESAFDKACAPDMDYSDAPSDSSTAPDGTAAATTYGSATHEIKTGIQLGATITKETSAVFGADNASDDGITVPTLIGGATANLSIAKSKIIATGTGTLHGWIDFNGDGAFGTVEHASVLVTGGTLAGPLTFSGYGTTMGAGTTYARFRLTSSKLTSANAAKAASDGEVEDYPLTIEPGGVVVSGKVYIDDNRTRTRETDEAGISNTVVVLHNTSLDRCQSVLTALNGDYQFTGVLGGNYEIYQAHGESIPVPAVCDSALAINPIGYNSTTADVLTITVNSLNVSDQDFGEIWETSTTTPENVGTGVTFEPDHQGEALPGNVIFYPHVLTIEAGGEIDFSSTASDNSDSGWTHVLYQDDDCNGILGGSEADTQLSTEGIAVAAGGQLCIINKVFAPANVSARGRYNVTITAVATFDSSAESIPSATLTVADLTVSGQSVTTVPAAVIGVGASRLELTKKVKNMTQETAETARLNHAKPGDLLSYRIYYKNSGTGPITDLRVNDKVPPFTGFFGGSNACDVTPTGMGCTANISFDDLNWVFTGPLVGGAEGYVSYEVMVDN